jgi:hypothetical protein
MKKAYRTTLLYTAFCISAINASCQLTTPAYLNYMQADSVHFPLQYYTDYMFPTNARYVLADTGIPMTNELLIQSFGVMFDTIIDANYKDTAYNPLVVRNITIDSIHVIIGQCNHSGTQDTIIVQIDSINVADNYLTPTVLYEDTVLLGLTGLSQGNNWLNPLTLAVKPNYPNGYLVNSSKFAVMVSFYGSKQDTMGFLPGFPYSNCKAGGSGVVPEGTDIGYSFGNIKANSITSGYQHFFNNTDTIPTLAGSTDGLYIRCTNPSSRYWYFQDNPVSAYINFTNTTGINELKTSGIYVSQNSPNPFRTHTEITYNLVASSNVLFTVNDLTGRELMNKLFASQEPGKYVITLEANQFAPGIYFYTFIVNGSSVTKKMVVGQD